MSYAARPYQVKAREDIAAAFAAGARAVLLVLPTGAGKTEVFGDVTERVSRNGGTVLLTAHRRELIRQASAKLARAGVNHGVIMPGERRTFDRVQVGSIQTLGRRLDKLPKFKLLVFDEAHHAVAGQWAKLIAAQPDANILGVTATPERLDGRGLGDVFDVMVKGPSIAELVAAGYLVPSRVYAPAAPPDVSALHMLAGDFNPRELNDVMDTPALIGDMAAHYERLTPGQPAIAFCTSVAHAESVARGFRAEGWRFKALHGGMSAAERDEALAALASGKLHGITACDLVSEGLDLPNVSVVIHARPTQSLGLKMQMDGRGMRLAEGKTHLTILDHAGNTLRHGMPDEPREWSLECRTKKNRTAPPTRQCPDCFAIHSPRPTCPACGFDYAAAEARAKRREIEQREGELALMTPGDRRLATLRDAPLADLLREARTFDEYDEIRAARGYLSGWTPRMVAMRAKSDRGASTEGREFFA